MLLAFRAMLKTVCKNFCGMYLDKFLKHLGDFLLQHLVTLARLEAHNSRFR